MKEQPCRERDSAGQEFCVALAASGHTKCVAHQRHPRVRPQLIGKRYPPLRPLDPEGEEVNAGS